MSWDVRLWLLSGLLLLPLLASAQSPAYTWRSFSTAEESNDIRNLLNAFDEAQLSHPQLLPRMAEKSHLFSIQAIRDNKKDFDIPLARQLLRAQGYFCERNVEEAGFWYKEKALTSLLFRSLVPDSVAPVLRAALEHDPYSMPFLFVETYVEDILKREEMPMSDLISAFVFLDNLLLNGEGLFPGKLGEFQDLCLRVADKLQASCKDCDGLRKQFGSTVEKSLLSPAEYGEVYTLLRVRGCARDALRDTVLNRVATLRLSPYYCRISSKEYLERESYLKAQQLLESSLKASKDKRFQAMDCLRLAEVFQQQKEFRTARIYALRADEWWPDWGRPWLFLADMAQRSAPFCDFGTLDRKAVNWLAIDYCETATNRNPKLFHQAQERIQNYKKAMPSKEEVLFNGLQMGDTFPLRCWMEVATTVRY